MTSTNRPARFGGVRMLTLCARRIGAASARAGTLVVVVTALASTAVRAERVAVMPLGSEALLPSVRDSLEADLRASVEKLDAVAVQPAAETRALIDEAAQNGLDLASCPAARDDCALKIGALADVDAVITFRVDEVADRLLLRGSYLFVDGSQRRHIAGELISPQRDNGVSLKAFVARLVRGQGRAQSLPFRLRVEPAASEVRVDGAPAAAGYLWLAPGNHALHIDAPGRAPVERTIVVHEDGENNELVLALSEADTPVPFYVGVATAGVGGFLALAAGAVATFVEAELEAGQISHANRKSYVSTGLASLGVAGGGVVLLGAGATVAVWPAATSALSAGAE